MTHFALGFRVKSGWAAAVLISVSTDAPCLCASEVIDLCDRREPATQQPYHAAMGKLETNGTKLKQRIESVRRATKQSIVDLRRRCAEGGYAVERAGLGTLREGQKISYEIVADRRSGKSSADNLRAAG